MSSKKLIKTPSVLYEFNKAFRPYGDWVKYKGLLYIPVDDFPDDYSNIGDYEKLILLSLDNSESFVQKSDFVNLHGRMNIMAYIKKSHQNNIIGAKFLLRKNNQYKDGNKNIHVSVDTDSIDFAESEIDKLYKKQIEWK